MPGFVWRTHGRCLDHAVPYPNVNSIHIYPVHKPPLLLRNLDIIPAHLPLPHLAIGGKSPVLKSVAPLPLHSIRAILIFVPELHRYLVVRESKKLFAQTVGLFFRPLGCEEVFDGGGSLEEVAAVAPDAVGGVGFGYGFGISSSRGAVLEHGH
jgi:hypothetical protein